MSLCVSRFVLLSVARPKCAYEVLQSQTGDIKALCYSKLKPCGISIQSVLGIFFVHGAERKEQFAINDTIYFCKPKVQQASWLHATCTMYGT